MNAILSDHGVDQSFATVKKVNDYKSLNDLNEQELMLHSL